MHRTTTLVAAGFCIATMSGRLDAQESIGGHAEEQEQDAHIEFGGYGSFRYDWSDAPGAVPSLTLRRIVIGGEGRLSRRFRVETEIEFERFGSFEVERSTDRSSGGTAFEHELEGTPGSEISLEQAWGEFLLLPGLSLRAGAVLPPLGRFNQDHEDHDGDLPARPLIDRDASVLPVPAAWTELGVGLGGDLTVSAALHAGYEAYVLNGAQLDFSAATRIGASEAGDAPVELEAEARPQKGAVNGAARMDALAGRLWLGGEAAALAVSGYTGRYTPEWMEPATLRIVGLDGRLEVAHVRLRGEVLSAWYGDAARVAENWVRGASSGLSGAATGTELAVKLSGFSRRRYGFWIDGARPFALGHGNDDGTIAPVVRYERVWFSDDVLEANVTSASTPLVRLADRAQDRVWLGLALRPAPRAVVQLAYVRSRSLKGTLIAPAVDADVVQGVSLGLAFGF